MHSSSAVFKPDLTNLTASFRVVDGDDGVDGMQLTALEKGEVRRAEQPVSIF